MKWRTKVYRQDWGTWYRVACEKYDISLKSWGFTFKIRLGFMFSRAYFEFNIKIFWIVNH